MKLVSEMKLMSVQNMLDLIDRMSEIYVEEYQEIQLRHGGSPLKTSGKSICLGDAEKELQFFREWKSREEREYTALVLGGYIVLNEYELLDSNTINLHCVDEIKAF